MEIIIAKDAAARYRARQIRYGLNPSPDWEETLSKVQGRALQVETDHLFKDQFNTAPIPKVSKQGLRLMNEDVESVVNDARAGRVRCGYCGGHFLRVDGHPTSKHPECKEDKYWEALDTCPPGERVRPNKPETQLEAFAKEDGLSMTTERLPGREDGDRAAGSAHFKITLHKGKRVAGFKYSMGPGLYPKPKLADVLQCLQSDAQSAEDYEGVEDFQKEFGYEDKSEARRVFNACHMTKAKLAALLGVEGLKVFLKLEGD